MMYQNVVIKQEPQDQYDDRNEMIDQNAVIKQELQDQYEDRNAMMDQNAVIILNKNRKTSMKIAMK